MPHLRPFSVMAGGVAVRLAAAALLLSVSCSAAARQTEFGRAPLLADAADGRLDDRSLLDAAVIAGGVHQSRSLADARRRLDALWLEVGQPLIDRLPDADRPQAILSALHRLILTGKYRGECTEVQQTLQTGDYNCVTATILYLELCRRHGLRGVAVAIPGHVYCRLQGTSQQDVQTTCREWFDVCEGRASSPAAEALARQLAEQPAGPRELSEPELLGKVYYNRGVSHLEAHDYAGAIELLEISLALDPQDGPARNNLLAAHNNWALMLCDGGNYAAAAEKLAAGRAIDPHYGPLRTNDLYVHQKWVLHLCDQGRYSAAVELLDAGFQRRPDAPLFDAGRLAVYGMWSRTLLESSRVREALLVLETAQQRFGDDEELIRQEVQAFVAAIERLLGNGRTRDAQQLLEVALQRHPSAEALHKLASEWSNIPLPAPAAF